MLRAHATNRTAKRKGSFQADCQNVLRVQGEVVTNGDSATRPERKIFTLPSVLPETRRDLVGSDRYAECGISHSESGDLPCRRQVAVQEQRRNRKHIADVVKPIAGIVGGKQRLGVDLEPEQ